MKKSVIFAAAVLAAVLVCAGARAEDVPKSWPVLYLFAHQDDELGAVAKIATDVRAGRNVFVVWVTDGAGTAAKDVREKESRAAMALIGVPDGNLFFLGYPDRYSVKHIEEAYKQILDIVNANGVAEITTDAYEGGSVDHDVTSLIGAYVSRNSKPRPVHYEIPLYNMYKNVYRLGKFLPFPGAETLSTPVDAGMADLKVKALEMYPSQAAIVNTMKAMSSKKELIKNGESYRVSPAYDYMKRPSDETLNYETNTRNPITFKDWQDAVSAFISKFKQ